MSVRRWTPLFFVPTPVLRFVLGDPSWWVPVALWLGGLAGMAVLTVCALGSGAVCLGLLVLPWLWAAVCHLLVTGIWDELRLREGLPSVIGWWIALHLGWFLPGAPRWTVLRYPRGGLCDRLERLRVWELDDGGVRASLEEWFPAESPNDTRWVTEVDGAMASELLDALEEYRVTGPGRPKRSAGIVTMGLSPLVDTLHRRWGVLDWRSAFRDPYAHYPGLDRYWQARRDVGGVLDEGRLYEEIVRGRLADTNG